METLFSINFYNTVRIRGTCRVSSLVMQVCPGAGTLKCVYNFTLWFLATEGLNEKITQQKWGFLHDLYCLHLNHPVRITVTGSNVLVIICVCSCNLVTGFDHFQALPLSQIQYAIKV